ncbi:uncharacterized protein CcaverHIS019_0209730 [Cutaneotrichosporon cavernicola]|uniref:Calcineurin-like phosphoesterase domain-containing protein n=1 Tax=Cutaneotrichosporon cavernicola TaxID=279322 RepID=A0AA48IEB0_9TREE|nr:uncharacterized protein CcaverHIS019_0209730 [Cutaneotrichosporon cavernicola]BEI89611.1 hypothetical protein CcaverHIS019_0209730 [Cutaneotrichosporon cavernicola]
MKLSLSLLLLAAVLPQRPAEHDLMYDDGVIRRISASGCHSTTVRHLRGVAGTSDHLGLDESQVKDSQLWFALTHQRHIELAQELYTNATREKIALLQFLHRNADATHESDIERSRKVEEQLESIRQSFSSSRSVLQNLADVAFRLDFMQGRLEDSITYFSEGQRKSWDDMTEHMKHSLAIAIHRAQEDLSQLQRGAVHENALRDLGTQWLDQAEHLNEVLDEVDHKAASLAPQLAAFSDDFMEHQNQVQESVKLARIQTAMYAREVQDAFSLLNISIKSIALPSPSLWGSPGTSLVSLLSGSPLFLDHHRQFWPGIQMGLWIVSHVLRALWAGLYGIDPIAKHTTGITELAVVTCFLSPKIITYCQPKTTPEEDTAKGQWVLVDSDLNHRTGLTFLYLYYRRTRRLDVALVTDLQIVPDPPPTELVADGWLQAPGNLRSGVFPRQPKLRLLYKIEAQGKRQHITEVMPHFGDGAPFFGFERVPGGKVVDGKKGRWQSVDIVYRRGNPIAPAIEAPKFRIDGSFKIMQIADLHFSVGKGECRDTDKNPCAAYPDTAAWLAEALDAEKPDMVVFSGDQLNGQKTSYDSLSVLATFAEPVIARKIQWAAVFGNHDSEIADDREMQMRALASMPYSLARLGPAEVAGVGNYDVRILSPDASRTHIFTLYFLDSGAYKKSMLPFVQPGYDYIRESQTEWFRKTSATVDPIERPFRPDGADDLGKIWKRRLGRRQSTPTFAKPNAMMWFHIPLVEAYDPADPTDDAAFADSKLNLGTSDAPDDKSVSRLTNGGFFSNGIEKMLESDGERRTEVKVLSHGHVHNTDRCRRVRGVWMCFNGGSSYGGYGKVGFDRRVRLYDVTDWGETISTYKRLTSGEIIDRQVLVGAGAPAGWGKWFEARYV